MLRLNIKTKISGFLLLISGAFAMNTGNPGNAIILTPLSPNPTSSVIPTGQQTNDPFQQILREIGGLRTAQAAQTAQIASLQEQIEQLREQTNYTWILNLEMNIYSLVNILERIEAQGHDGRSSSDRKLTHEKNRYWDNIINVCKMLKIELHEHEPIFANRFAKIQDAVFDKKLEITKRLFKKD